MVLCNHLEIREIGVVFVMAKNKKIAQPLYHEQILENPCGSGLQLRQTEANYHERTAAL